MTSAWILWVILGVMLKWYARAVYEEMGAEAVARLDKSCHPW